MRDNYLKYIKKSTLLNSLSSDEIRSYLSQGLVKVVTYKKNSVVHFDGECCTKLDVILTGKVVVERIDESGNLLSIADFYSDDILGGNLLFSKNPYYPMTITTQLPTIILEIPRDLLFDIFCQNKLFLRTYLELVSDHASILSDKIKHYINKSIRESVISYLEYEQKRQNSTKIKLPISKKLLAEKIGVQRTSLSRELKKMQNDGLIRFDGKHITVLDLDR